MRCLFPMAFILFGMVPAFASAQEANQDTPDAEQLARWLKEYPEADANKDGVLTLVKRKPIASSYFANNRIGHFGRTTVLKRNSLSPQCRMEWRLPWQSGFLVISIRTIRTHMARDVRDDGIPGFDRPQNPRDFGDRYVTVRASVRGAGASGGTIHAISHRTGMDGHEIIENWIVKQPWSNGKVGVARPFVGRSYRIHDCRDKPTSSDGRGRFRTF